MYARLWSSARVLEVLLVACKQANRARPAQPSPARVSSAANKRARRALAAARNKAARPRPKRTTAAARRMETCDGAAVGSWGILGLCARDKASIEYFWRAACVSPVLTPLLPVATRPKLLRPAIAPAGTPANKNIHPHPSQEHPPSHGHPAERRRCALRRRPPAAELPPARAAA